MFKRASRVGKIIFALLLFGCVAQFCIVRKKDITTYKKLLQDYETHSTVRSLPNAAHQIRTTVDKEIWFTQEDRTRLHYRIHGQSSLLTLEPIDKKIHIVENLNQVQCWMQDRLYVQTASNEPMQQMRFWEADHGVYRYTTQQLLAQDVNISIFRLPGHALPYTCDPRIAFLNGIANNVSFSITGKTPQFEANQFKATLTQTEL